MPRRPAYRAPYRSHRTELTDDELALLDVMFDKVGTLEPMVRRLSSAEFGLAFNTRNVPRRAPSRRRALVHAMVERGIFEITRHRGESRLGVSRAGGALWELEREVPWETYADARYRVSHDDRDEEPTRLTIRAFSSRIAEAYLDALVPLLGGSPVRRWPARTERRSTCIPWKRPDMVVITARGCWGEIEGPWPLGEWWSDVERLTALR